MLLAFLISLFSLLMVIAVHEAGHALIARIFGIKILRISLGFGRMLLRWKSRKDVEWVWALWPLGGFVQFLDSRLQVVSAEEHTVCFDKQRPWVRSLVLLAGAGANFMMAIILLTGLYFLGFQQRAPEIQSVKPESIAAKAGFLTGDRFISIAGKSTTSWNEVGMALITVLGKGNVIVKVRDKKGRLRSLNMDVTHWSWQEHSLLTTLGVTPNKTKTVEYQLPGMGLAQALHHALRQSVELIGFFAVIFKQILTKQLPFSLLLGPFGFLATSMGAFVQGPAVFCYFLALLSLAVGCLNLLPIPGLDGGLLLYAFIEKIRGKPVSFAWEILLYRLALICFAVLFVQLLLNDVQFYLKHVSIKKTF